MSNNGNVRAVNTAAIFADIGASVSDIDLQLNKYKEIYDTYDNLLEKVKLGRTIVELACCKLGFMTLIINDDEFLAIDLASLIPTTTEMLKFIDDMERVAMMIENPVDRMEASNIAFSSRIKLYDTKVFFYRFVDLSTLQGGMSGLKL